MSDVARLRRAANCVYIAVEKSIADDLSTMLLGAANEIDSLRTALAEAERYRKDVSASLVFVSKRCPFSPNHGGCHFPICEATCRGRPENALAEAERERDQALMRGKRDFDLAVAHQDRAERAEARVAELEAQNKHMCSVLIDAEHALGVEETGELILHPINRLIARAERAEAQCKVFFEQKQNAEEACTRAEAELAQLQDSESIEAITLRTDLVRRRHPNPTEENDGTS